MARRRNRPASTTSVVGIAIGFDGDPYGPRDPVAPERFYRSQSQPNIDWPGLVGQGENSNGYRSVTPNGTLTDQGNGWNQPQYYTSNRGNGRRWSPPINWGKNGGNRTGE